MNDLSYLVAKQRQNIIDYYKNQDELQIRQRIKEEVEKEEKVKANKTIIEELEKITVKICQMPNANPSYWNACDVVDRADLLYMIDEELSELKGENNK